METFQLKATAIWREIALRLNRGQWVMEGPLRCLGVVFNRRGISIGKRNGSVFEVIRGIPLSVICIICGAMSCWPAAAQQGNASEPGKIEDRIPQPGGTRGSVAPIVPPSVLAPSAALGSLKFVLAGVRITGATVYSPSELSRAYESFLGQEVSAREIGVILDAITKKYLDGGYILSRATAPAQTIQRGILHIEVSEGFIESVALRGDTGRVGSRLRAMAERVKESRPLRLKVLECYLLLMADVPGLRVFPAIRPIKEKRDGYVLDLTLKHQPIGTIVSLNNRGSTEVGPLQAFGAIDLNSMLATGDRTRFTVFGVPDSPEELRYGQVHHEQLLNEEGTRVWVSASRSLVDTHEALIAADDKSSATRFMVGLSHPFVRGQGFNAFASVILDSLDAERNSASAVYEDRLRVVRLAGQVGFKDDFGGTNSFSVEASKGLEILNATDTNDIMISRPGGRPDFFKIRLDGSRRQKLTDGIHLLATASGQTSAHTLLASEEFTVGGQRFGRAYDPGIISGSEGAAGGVELQFDLSEKPPAIRYAQVFAFYDIGVVWGSGFTRRSAASAGGGIRVGLPFNFSADIELGWPLTRPPTAGGSDVTNPRVFFNILHRF